MEEWLVIKLTCRAALARRLGARRERRMSPRQDQISIEDEQGHPWAWELPIELLAFEGDYLEPESGS
jgi:hypothetical protein